MYTNPIGTSTCILEDVPFATAIPEIAAAGITHIELSTSLVRLLVHNQFLQAAPQLGELAQSVGATLWSLHLPFSRIYDISSVSGRSRSEAIDCNLALIRAASQAGIGTVVLHPSSEPITDEARPQRMENSRNAILAHVECAEKYGITVAVEDLPRTCLCNRAEEMLTLLHGTGAKVCFDTNHCLHEDSVTFLKALHAGGAKVATVHFSDYDRVDERHFMPGVGVNDWAGILAALTEGGYTGPILYEVSKHPRSTPEVTNTPADLYANYQKLIRL